MIYTRPAADAPLDQGDIIESCPILRIASFIADNPGALEVQHDFQRVVVLTQTCRLLSKNPTHVAVAEVLDASILVRKGEVKAAEVKGQIRAGRVFGWYFLPEDAESGLPESLIDFEQPHTVRADILHALAQRGKRRASVKELFREHLNGHFGQTFARIGLPFQYPTKD